MKPTPGRIVHFIDPTRSEHFPAIIFRTEVRPEGETTGRIDLDVFGDTSYRGIQYGVVEDQTGTHARSWHWPEREEATTEEPFHASWQTMDELIKEHDAGKSKNLRTYVEQEDRRGEPV